jgi:hypothetical protein
MAIKQGEKVRPVLNLSLPKNCSFNSNVDEEKLEKVYMSSAQKFSKTLLEAGPNSKMYKFDLVDAYKNVPAKLEDFRIQGFSWLGRYFFETKQIFGAKTAVCNFDILGNTILALALCECDIPKKFVHRTLDDVPVVSPAHTNWGEKFCCAYLDVCKKLNMSVTSSCPKFEKAFTNSSYGKVLGIFFDSQLLTWSLPFQKTEKTLKAIKDTLECDFLDLESFEKLMGRLNYVSQFSNFLRGFKFNLNKCLGQLQTGNVIRLSPEAKFEIYVFANFLNDDVQWHKIDPIHYNPPLGHYTFASDAAGGAGGKEKGDAGCGSVGFDESGEIIFAKQLLWPESDFLDWTDGKGSKMSQKTTTLEFIGVLLPFITIPELLVNKYVVVSVDNLACYFGWINRQAAGDATASIFIRALHLISLFLGCEVHIKHLPRLSNWEAQLVDRISRRSTTTKYDEALLRSFDFDKIPVCLEEWLKCPSDDWDISLNLLMFVKNKLIKDDM